VASDRRFSFASILRILATKDQSHDQTQNAHSRHHSQDGWHAEFTLQNRQDEDTESRSNLRNTRSEAAGMHHSLDSAGVICVHIDT